MVRRQFLTPPNLPETTVSRCLVIPNSKEWLGIFNSVLLETAQAYNYEQVNPTDMTPEDVAALCYTIYEIYLQGICDVDCADVAACLYPIGRLQRMNPTTGRYEVSDDGGSTWQDASEIDPRFVAPRNEQAVNFDCDDAKAIVGYIQNMIDELKDEIDLGYTILGLVAALVSVLAIVFSFGAVAPVAIAFAGALTGITSAAITAALTVDVWERLLCNIHCHISDGSEVTTAQFDEILVQLGADETGLAYTVLWHAINQMGPVGLHNAVSLNTPTTGLPADCTGCDCDDIWCYTFDFKTASHDTVWTKVGTPGTWVSGQGWRATMSGPSHEGVVLETTIAAREITRVDVQVNLGGPHRVTEIALDNITVDSCNPCAAGVSVVSWEGLESSTNIDLGIEVNLSQYGGIEAVTIWGNGSNPFGTDNCP